MPMSWELDAEHRDFQAVCRAFVDRHVRPAVGEAEALGRYIEESAVARHYRDVRVLRIGGGADEIQLEILSRELTP
jgi:hypothetical protein